MGAMILLILSGEIKKKMHTDLSVIIEYHIKPTVIISSPAAQVQPLLCIKRHVHVLFLLFLGLLLAATSIGPAFGFITGSIMLRFYVDFDKLSKGERKCCAADQSMLNASNEVEFICKSYFRKKGGLALYSCLSSQGHFPPHKTLQRQMT